MTEYDESTREKLRQRRQSIFDRVTAKYRDRGSPIDIDPKFLALVAAWIEGRVEMADVTTGYAEIRRAARRSSQREPLQSGVGPTALNLTQEQLNAELEQVIGISKLNIEETSNIAKPEQ